MTNLQGKSPAPVILASPVSQPLSVWHSASKEGPAAEWMAPSTPPPPSREVLAALTMASTARVVMSVRMREMWGLKREVAVGEVGDEGVGAWSFDVV